MSLTKFISSVNVRVWPFEIILELKTFYLGTIEYYIYNIYKRIFVAIGMYFIT